MTLRPISDHEFASTDWPSGTRIALEFMGGGYPDYPAPVLRASLPQNLVLEHLVTIDGVTATIPTAPRRPGQTARQFRADRRRYARARHAVKSLGADLGPAMLTIRAVVR